MGFWSRSNDHDSWGMSPEEIRQTMSDFGLAPGNNSRGLFGWTDEDDRRSATTSIRNLQLKLAEIQLGEGSLREEIEVQIKIRAFQRFLDGPDSAG